MGLLGMFKSKEPAKKASDDILLLHAMMLIKSSMGFLGPKGSDGYTFSLTGPLSRLQPRPGR